MNGLMRIRLTKGLDPLTGEMRTVKGIISIYNSKHQTKKRCLL